MAAAHTVATTVPAAAPTVPAARLGLLQQLGRLVSLLKYSLVFSAAIVVLPLSGIEGVALHSMTGSLFVELSPGGVFWASLFLLAAAWSVMLTTGLIVNGVTQRWSSTAGGYRRFESLKAAPSGQIPDWAELLFSVPVTPPQLVYYAALAVPGLVVVVRYAVRYEVDRVVAGGAVLLTALGAAGAGLVTAYIVMLGLCTPAALLDPTDPPMRDPVALRVWGVLTQLTRLTTAMRWLQRQLSALAAWLRLHYLLDPATRLLYPAHFFAITVAVLLVVLWLAFAFLFRPEDGLLRAAPVVHLWVSLMLFVWVFGGLEFHLARLRVSPLLAVIVVVLLGYNVFSIDHTYHVRREGSASGLSPVAVVEGGGANLVVIASAGGGISAAVWTTLGLERLIQERPDLRREIRLLSTISGGSVGGAFFLDGLLRPPPASSLDTIRKKSGASSLDAVAYGLAYRDVPSLLTGGLSTLAPGRDRGELLERAWTRTAEGSTRGAMVRRGAHKDPPTLASLQSRIRSGEIPGFIFGATVMESGRRVMVTPIDFTEVTIPVPGPAAPGSPTGQALLARPKPRAATLSEYLGDPGLDMSLWTAARLSATFSFVSPAARSTLADQDKETRKTPEIERRRLWHHLIDGGYYDNFGVTSALDWLTPVMIAKAEKRLSFTRVAIIELRAFRREKPVYAQPAPGSVAALLGPVIGLGAIRAGAAAERDDIDVGRFTDVWNKWFDGQGLPVCVESFVFEPDADQPSPPLSWQLSSVQMQRLVSAWPPPASQNRAVSDTLGWESARLMRFLTSGCPGRG